MRIRKSVGLMVGHSVGVSLLLTALSVSAADFTWLGAASGDWNETDENWSGAGTVWTNSSANNASFGASSAMNVTAADVTLSNITFNADGYVIGGGSLLMYGGFTVGSGMSALVTASVTNSFGVCEKKGAGTLVLDTSTGRTNLFSTLSVSEGLVHVRGGTHEIYTNSSSTIYIGFHINNGAMLVSGGKVRTTGPGYSDVRGSLLITNGVVDLSSSRELLNAFNAAGTTTVSGNGELNVNTFRVSQYAGTAALNAINVNTGGVIRLNYFAIDPGASPKGMVNFNGGTVVAKMNTPDFLGTWTNMWLTGISARILEGGAVIDTGANAISIKQPLVSGASVDGGLTKKGVGPLFLLSTNSYNGPTVIDQGMLTFDPQTYTQTLYSTITCTDTSCTLAKAGSGMLVLDPGPGAVNSFGTLLCSNGTVVVASGTNLVNRYCGAQNGPGLRVAGGTLLVAGGLLKTTTGLFVNVDGGHLLVTNGVADLSSCSEILNGIGSIYGYTTVSDSGVIIAQRVRVSQNSGNPSNTVVSVNTGGVLRLNSFYIDLNFPMQKGMVFLNGGTVEARQDTADFLGTTATLVGNNNDKWLTNIFVHVREGGAIFNTAGRTISIKQPLFTGAQSDGGLTKRGLGSLTLMNTNTYNGVTSVEGGTLVFGKDDLLPSANTVRVSSNAVLNINGKVQTLAGIGGSGTVTNLASLSVTDTIAPGDAGSFGTLTLAAAPASMAGCTLSVNVSTNGACDRLHVQGDLDLSTLSLSVDDTAQLSQFKKYTVASCTGTLTVPFSSIGTLPLRWRVKYDAPSKTAYLVYDFGTLLVIQ